MPTDYLRDLVSLIAVISFVIFIVAIYLPRMKHRVASPLRDFFKNGTAALETLIFLMLYAILFYTLFFFPDAALSPSLAAPGSLLALAGLVLALIGRLTLRKHWRPVTNPGKPDVLLTSGIFRYLRHPIYAGRILFFMGVMLMFASPLVILTIVYWYTLRMKARREEHLLTGLPGYAEYRQRVFSPF
ncbi:MAG: isoprenylcysteine carboxylmethyltransferase family protein [Patescibacteria group bacterium]